MGPDTSATKVSLDSVDFADGLSEDEGWIRMRVQFLISEANAGAQEVVFGRTIFRPALATTPIVTRMPRRSSICSPARGS